MACDLMTTMCHQFDDLRNGRSHLSEYEEGRFRFPRPRIVDSDGTMVEDGDILLIGFANSNLANPVILATVFPIITLDDFKGTDPEKHIEHRSSERRSYCDTDT